MLSPRKTTVSLSRSAKSARADILRNPSPRINRLSARPLRQPAIVFSPSSGCRENRVSGVGCRVSEQKTEDRKRSSRKPEKRILAGTQDPRNRTHPTPTSRGKSDTRYPTPGFSSGDDRLDNVAVDIGDPHIA